MDDRTKILIKISEYLTEGLSKYSPWIYTCAHVSVSVEEEAEFSLTASVHPTCIENFPRICAGSSSLTELLEPKLYPASGKFLDTSGVGISASHTVPNKVLQESGVEGTLQNFHQSFLPTFCTSLAFLDPRTGWPAEAAGTMPEINLFDSGYPPQWEEGRDCSQCNHLMVSCRSPNVDLRWARLRKPPYGAIWGGRLFGWVHRECYESIMHPNTPAEDYDERL
jgi:hypothetical protein